MRQIGILIGDLVDVEIPRAGDVRFEELGFTVLVLVGQVFRGVEDQQPRLTQFGREKFGCDKRTHRVSLPVRMRGGSVPGGPLESIRVRAVSRSQPGPGIFGKLCKPPPRDTQGCLLSQ